MYKQLNEFFSRRYFSKIIFNFHQNGHYVFFLIFGKVHFIYIDGLMGCWFVLCIRFMNYNYNYNLLPLACVNVLPNKKGGHGTNTYKKLKPRHRDEGIDGQSPAKRKSNSSSFLLTHTLSILGFKSDANTVEGRHLYVLGC